MRDVYIECERWSEDGSRQPYNVDGGEIPFVLPEKALVQINVDWFTVLVPAIALRPEMMISTTNRDDVIYVKRVSVSPDDDE